MFEMSQLQPHVMTCPSKFTVCVQALRWSWPKGVGDINGDSKSDLVFSYYLDYGHPGGYCMTLWYGRESGTFINTEADAYLVLILALHGLDPVATQSTHREWVM